ncbi:MAG: hypothetical protein E7574_04620 [Ruminococcaceae bacterium]|nr:hypothetical protein [Oscillospiraceae bacterium]
MKERKTIKAYFEQKDTKGIETVFMVMTGVGAVLVALWIFLYLGVGFFGFPFLIIGGCGWVFTHSSRVTEDDFDSEVKRIMLINNIEETEHTLKEYIIGKSGHIKKGKDKKVRTAFYCVTAFVFKKETFSIKKYTIDLFEESFTVSEYKLNVGCEHKILEKTYTTAIGEVKRNYLSITGEEEIIIPVNINVYDTDAVMKKISSKR